MVNWEFKFLLQHLVTPDRKYHFHFRHFFLYRREYEKAKMHAKAYFSLRGSPDVDFYFDRQLSETFQK